MVFIFKLKFFICKKKIPFQETKDERLMEQQQRKKNEIRMTE